MDLDAIEKLMESIWRTSVRRFVEVEKYDREVEIQARFFLDLATRLPPDSGVVSRLEERLKVRAQGHNPEADLVLLRKDTGKPVVLVEFKTFGMASLHETKGRTGSDFEKLMWGRRNGVERGYLFYHWGYASPAQEGTLAHLRGEDTLTQGDWRPGYYRLGHGSPVENAVPWTVERF